MKAKRKPNGRTFMPAQNLETAKISKRSNSKNQTKLNPGSAGDSLEHEAEAVADRVIRMPDVISKGATDSVQRQCAACSEEENVQRKEMPSFMESKLAETAGNGLENKIAEARGGGSQMSEAVRSFMENRFETDFSNVRIHTDSKAIELNNDLNAQAFAVGDDVFFNEGKYSPEGESGKHLLAHELTHTIQQDASQKTVQKQPAKDDPASGWEHDDESFAKRVAEHHLLAQHKVMDTIKKVDRLSPASAITRECLVTTEGGLQVKVLWSTDTNKVVAKSCAGGPCKACGYDYSASDKGNLSLTKIRCWMIAGI